MKRGVAWSVGLSVGAHAAAIAMLWGCRWLGAPPGRTGASVDVPIDVELEVSSMVTAAPFTDVSPSPVPNKLVKSARFEAHRRESHHADPSDEPGSPAVVRPEPVATTAADVAPVTSTPADLRLRRDPAAAPSTPPLFVTPPTRNLRNDGPAAPLAELPIRPGQVIERPGFLARVAEDGSIAFDDRAPVAVDGDLLSPAERLGQWKRSPQDFASGRDGTLHLLDGKFDITDAIMRATGQDPYRYEREKVLDATRNQRLALGARARAARRRSALGDLPRMLGALWADGSQTFAERRRLLFQLWDECDEAPARRGQSGDRTDDVDDEGIAASTGEVARARIVAFIRATLPSTGREAYSASELARLNASRESRQPFQPYAVRD